MVVMALASLPVAKDVAQGVLANVRATQATAFLKARGPAPCPTPCIKRSQCKKILS